MKYEQFLASKRHSSGNYGFEAQWMPECVFDFQRFIIEKALRKGRIGIFADTGLGKTLMQVAIAENVIRQTNQRVLILTPLAVAFQFIDEAARIGVHDIEHTKDGTFTKKIVVCNYERMVLCSLLRECLPVIEAMLQMPGDDDSDAHLNGLMARVGDALKAIADDQVKRGES